MTAVGVMEARGAVPYWSRFDSSAADLIGERMKTKYLVTIRLDEGKPIQAKLGDEVSARALIELLPRTHQAVCEITLNEIRGATLGPLLLHLGEEPA